MIDFKRPDISDKTWVTDCVRRADIKNCEYAFANIFNWQKAVDLFIANVDGFYCSLSGKDKLYYGFPAGTGDIKPIIEKLIEDSRERGVMFTMRSVTAANRKLLEVLFPSKFTYTDDRDFYDYIYLAERLRTLAGKKLHSKRNHINRFTESYSWSYEEITRSNIDECRRMAEEWCERYGCADNIELAKETCAQRSAFDSFFALGLSGGLLRVDERVVAFSMGSPLTADTFTVHIEKAFHDIQGAYPMINQQFVLHNCDGYMYINREDDLGDEGLRKSKLSYYPDILLEKYTAVLAG